MVGERGKEYPLEAVLSQLLSKETIGVPTLEVVELKKYLKERGKVIKCENKKLFRNLQDVVDGSAFEVDVNNTVCNVGVSSTDNWVVIEG